MSHKLPRILTLVVALAVAGALAWTGGTADLGRAVLLFLSGMVAAFAIVSLMRHERRTRRRATRQGGGAGRDSGDRDSGGDDERRPGRGRSRGKGRGQGGQGGQGRERGQSGRGGGGGGGGGGRGKGQKGRVGKPVRKPGTVKWFDGAKGYGFITPDDGEEDCFVHRSSVKDGQALAEGERVEFHVIIDDRGRKAAAEVVSL